jgi:rfaE bifunctional protein kinase chain/domain
MDKIQTRLAKIARQFRGRTIGVLGDYMFDELLRGEATRISPEAPVPVVLMGQPHEGEGFPGGAGNVAANIASLGGRPIPFGVIGWDESGKRLLSLLEKRHIHCDALLRERGRVTPRKVRIVAHQHQLLRLDFEKSAEMSPRTANMLARRILQWIPRLDALIISDYRKGTVTTRLCDEVISAGWKKGLPIFVDPKPEQPQICRGATIVTPNLHEAEAMLGRPMRTRQELLAGGQRLLAELGCTHLLITRGSDGMMLFNQAGAPHDIPGIPRPVYDVTGAGDTVIAVLALACSSGAQMEDAARLANLAGGCVVLKFGTAEITPRELTDAIAGGDGPISN